MTDTIVDTRGPWGPLAEPMHVDRVFAPDDPPYRENVFLGLFDRERGFYGATHLQGGKTDAGMFARCSAVVDGRTTEIFEQLGEMTFESEHISFDLGGHLSARCDGFMLDLTLTPIREPVDYSVAATLPGLRKSEPLQHYQQAGTFSGTVSTESGSLAVAGSVIRDRTWGFRQEIASWIEYYAAFVTFDDFDLATMKFQTRDGHLPPHGQLSGSRTGTVVASTVRRRDAWGGIVELDLELADGNTLALSIAKPEARVFCPLNEPTGPEAFTSYDDFAEFRTPDGAVGFGIMEQGILRRQV
jgi:hypothetical protein